MEAKTPQFPQMLIREIAIRCGCTPNKVSGYLRKHAIQPVGSKPIDRKTHHITNLYEFTPYMEEYLLSEHKCGTPSAEGERERITSGWLTIYEVAAAWNCSCYKALTVLNESNAPQKWEHGEPYNGRKFYKAPEHPSRDPSKVHYNNIAQEDDWLESVHNESVRQMVLDERKWRGMVGGRVAVEMKRSGVTFDAVLLRYSMCWFDVRRDNGRVETYKHSEAKVVEVAE